MTSSIEARQTPAGSSTGRGEPIAIIGMSARFPGAVNVREYWGNLADGVESVRRYSREELGDLGVPDEVARDPAFVPAASVLDDFDRFDAAFFGFTRREAQLRDPQQRLFLETAHAALEDAGHDPSRYAGQIGVYAGVSANDYEKEVLRANPELLQKIGDMSLSVMSDADFMATLTSYALDLRGPSLTVMTACSTSLVAVHLASESLRNGECGMAVAGASALALTYLKGYRYHEGGVLSPDGRCRPFDADARGMAWGSGVAAVVLKRLADAVADGDTVRAVILGSAVTNDGAQKNGFTAPSVEGQAAAIERALNSARIDPRTVTYVEAHGTGTTAGDPVEIAALTRAYGHATSDRQWCAIGSVKSNIGHLVGAAGMAGLLKATLALENELIPPTLNVERPNPDLNLPSTPFYLSVKPTPWPRGTLPRRAAVSSIGMGGTNVHLILEEPPHLPSAQSEWPRHLLPVSAKSETALTELLAKLGAHLGASGSLDLADVAHTLQVGRAQHPHRACVVAGTLTDAVAALSATDGRRILTGHAGDVPPKVAFMFSGQGSQHPDMGRGLYETWSPFRSAFDRCADILHPHLMLDLRDVLFAEAEDRQHTAERLAQTEITQPVLFALEYALAQLWRSWGVHPAAMIGHSVGELVAACLASVFSLEDALGLVAARGRLMQTVEPGTMLAVPLAEPETRSVLPAELSLAAINAASLCVVAGPTNVVAAFGDRLAADGITGTQLRTSHAFHSASMDPILDEFAGLVAEVPRKNPAIPFISNVSGNWISDEEATDPAYWASHIRQTVRFADGVTRLLERGDYALLEVGPGQTLANLARTQTTHPDLVPLATLPTAKDVDERGTAADCGSALRALGQLWLRGVDVDWERVGEPNRRRVPLPTYPFERQRHWIDAPAPSAPTDEPEHPRSAPLPLEDWFEVPVWRQAPPHARRRPVHEIGPCVVLCDEGELGDRLAERLRAAGCPVVTVHAAERYQARSAAAFDLRPAARDDYIELFDELAARGLEPARIICAWGLIPPPAHDIPLDPSRLADLQEGVFFSLLAVAQALAERSRRGPLALDVLTAHAQDVDGSDLLNPELALVAGPCRVIPLEVADVTCRHLDTDLPDDDAGRERVLERLVAELATDDVHPVVALRRGKRWVPAVNSVSVPPIQTSPWRPRGVYIITGGLGGVGTAIAEHLAERVRARLVLIGRTGLPPREGWAAWLSQHGGSDRTSRAIRAIQRMEARGADVSIHAADVTDATVLADVRDAVLARFGEVNGIVHAAGVPGGGMIEVKERAAADAVLAPKTFGTLAVAEAFGGLPLDVFVLCSSVAALAGGLGQVDYCAANAFLDAYARSPRSGTTPTIAVNWDGWRDVGMAAESVAPDGLNQNGRSARHSEINHPWLTERHDTDGGAVVLSGALAPDAHWVLDEHRMSGVPVLPATAHVELIRAAFCVAEPATGGTGNAIELREVAFLAPLAVGDGSTVRIEVVVEAGAEERPVVVRSVDGGGAAIVHAHASARWVDVGPAPKHDIEAIGVRCPAVEEVTGETRSGQLLTFGPRWSSVRRVHVGKGEELAVLDAPDVVATEVGEFGNHPALLDQAIGFATALDGRGDFLPFAYDVVRIRRPMPPRAHSHIRYPEQAGDETLLADLTITDDTGVEAIAIEGFMLRRVDEGALATALHAPMTAPVRAAGGSVALQSDSETDIQPRDGAEALSRLVAADLGPQVIVSALGLEKIARAKQAVTHQSLEQDRGIGTRLTPTRTAADVEKEPIASRTELEQQLAELWEESLGVDDVGVDDDFFELGGNSLVAVQLIWQVGNALGDKLPMRALFDAPTVAGMAQAIEQLRGAEASVEEPVIPRLSRGEV